MSASTEPIEFSCKLSQVFFRFNSIEEIPHQDTEFIYTTRLTFIDAVNA